MATREIVICDVCKQEIKKVPIIFSATRWETRDGVPLAKFDIADFCSPGCVLSAVRGLLNGAA